MEDRATPRGSSSQQLIIANLNEAYSHVSLHFDERALWELEYLHCSGRAYFWASLPHAVLLTHAPPTPETQAHWKRFCLRPGPAVVAIPFKSFDLSSDILCSSVLGKVSDSFGTASVVELSYWVATAGVAEIARFLERRGVAVSPSSVELNAEAEITTRCYSRRSLCSFLEDSVPEPELRPEWHQFADFECLRQFLSTSPPARHWVLKGNDSVGGCGIIYVTSGADRARLLSGNGPSRPPTEADAYLWLNPPYVLEQCVCDPGDLERNVSPTVDFHVDWSRMEVFSGIQVLYRQHSYGGVLTGTLPSKTNDAVRSIAHGVRARMEDRGYKGPLNLDFVVTPSGTIALAEANLRRSAPLDHFLTARETFAGRSIHLSLDFLNPGLFRELQRVCGQGKHVEIHPRLLQCDSRDKWVGAMMCADSLEDMARVLTTTGALEVANLKHLLGETCLQVM